MTRRSERSLKKETFIAGARCAPAGVLCGVADNNQRLQPCN